jgi:hypothetical protein
MFQSSIACLMAFFLKIDLLASSDSLSKQAGVQLNGVCRIIVARNRVGDTARVLVRVNDANGGHVACLCFLQAMTVKGTLAMGQNDGSPLLLLH